MLNHFIGFNFNRQISFLSPSSGFTGQAGELALLAHSFSCFLFWFVNIDRKKKLLCTVLLGMATTLLPKHFVRQVVMWTLKTKKGKLHSWQHQLEVTMISWNAWQNTELTLMQQTRLVMGEWVTSSQELYAEDMSDTGLFIPLNYFP